MYKALIVDDEETARETIVLLLKKYNANIELVGKAQNADEGIKLINKHHPDILFLDINMPDKNGFEMLEYVSTKNIQIIFTTAYDEYAIKAINLSACYYLLKPIIYSEFEKAMNKAIDEIEYKIDLIKRNSFLLDFVEKPIKYPEKIIINNKNSYELVQVSEINYLEGEKNYTWIILSNNKLLSAKTLKEYEELFNPELFFRVHQSYIINKNYVKRILNTRPDQIELTTGTKLSIARDRKKDLMEWISK